jgi:hypothetical protein
MAFPRWSVGMINLGLVFVPYVTMPGGKGWWMLIRGVDYHNKRIKESMKLSE